MTDRPWIDISDKAMRTSYADWLREGGVGTFIDKAELIRSYARHLLSKGESATREKIDEMLDATGRGYARDRTYVSLALRGGPYGNWGDLAQLKLPKGGKARPVTVEGKPYPSIRAAAEGEGVAVETVRKRIRAGRKGWRYGDV